MAEPAMENTENTLPAGVWDEYLQTRRVDIRNDIVLHYSQLVKSIAQRMRGIYKNYAQLDDVVNQGIIALIDAVEKYDPARGVKFETFATIKVKGSVIDYIRAQDWFPRRLRKISSDVENANSKLSTELGHAPTHQELAKELAMTPGQLDRAMEQIYAYNMLSYEELLWKNMSSVRGGDDFSTDLADESPERHLLEEELRHHLAEAIDSLNERERLVISLYYHEKLKLREISGVMGISESRVCQIHAGAILKMRKNMYDYITI
jgi:RNA polymerase sigma factor for flagellar operon FliA